MRFGLRQTGPKTLHHCLIEGPERTASCYSEYFTKYPEFAGTVSKCALFFRGCGLNFSICAFETPSRTLPDIKMYEVLRRFVVVNLFAGASQRRDPVSLKVLLIPRVHKTWNSFQNCLCKVFDRCSLIDKLLAKESQRQCIAMWSEHDLLI